METKRLLTDAMRTRGLAITFRSELVALVACAADTPSDWTCAVHALQRFVMVTEAVSVTAGGYDRRAHVWMMMAWFYRNSARVE